MTADIAITPEPIATPLTPLRGLRLPARGWTCDCGHYHHYDSLARVVDPDECDCGPGLHMTTPSPSEAAAQIVGEMHADARAEYSRLAWAEGVSLMLSGEWEHLDVSDVLDVMDEML